MDIGHELREFERVSPVLAEALRRHPDWIPWLEARLDRSVPPDAAALQAAWLLWREEDARGVHPQGALRSFKLREYVDIAFRDIAGLASFQETISRLSVLAGWVIAAALEIAWDEVVRRLPEAPSSGPGAGMSIIAMGKLGGCELNYSSDVDLVFCRRPAGSDGEMRFFSRLGERLVQVLGEPGPEGLLYRTDMRLRPHGETGPLVPTIDSLENYYESWGEAWERQALIKARPVAGDEELGRRFMRFAGNFVFARQVDESSLEEVKRVKHRSEREYARGANRIHIKQGPGGIRDIEFYVQYLQLIAGTRHREVRVPSTLEAIRSLADVKALLDGEESQLSLAYVFLRTVEHRLQLRSLTPLAEIPENPAEVEALACGLGFGTSGEEARAFTRTLDAYRRRVRTILERVYLTPGYLRPREREEEFAQLLSERTPKEHVREMLGPYGFHDPEKAWQNIRLIALGPAGHLLPPGERRAFLEFVFPMLEVLRDSYDPDLALHHIESFAAATGNRVSFLRALASRRAHLARLANLVALSNMCHQVLVRHPEYFDSLARGIHLHEGRSMREMHDELTDRLGPAAGEERGKILRRYRQREMIRIAYRDLAGLAGPLEISEELSWLAEACLQAGLSLAAVSAPATVQEGLEFGPMRLPVHVIALGKLGSRQMHYASDLDVLVLYDDPPAERPAAARIDMQLLLDSCIERLIDLLGGVTAEGTAYKVDLRVRPEGATGLLARSWSSFQEYAQKYMQPWERMALVRSRILTDSKEARKRWKGVLSEIVYGFSWDRSALDSIRHLKRRIEKETNRESRTHMDFKFGAGGIVDLEFLIQFLQIKHGSMLQDIRTEVVADAIRSLREAGILPEGEAADLLEAHRFQRRVENHYQLMEDWISREISRESPMLNRLARSLGYPESTQGEARRAFLHDWDRTAACVRRYVERYFYASG